MEPLCRSTHLQAARQLLTLDPKDPKRLFEGPALLRRMTRFGLLGEDEKELDFVLQLTTEKLLERRLQTKVQGYILCGLPVILRNVLGDVHSTMVNEQNLHSTSVLSGWFHKVLF